MTDGNNKFSATRDKSAELSGYINVPNETAYTLKESEPIKQQEVLENKLAYWKKKLQGVVALDAQTDFTRKPSQHPQQASLSFKVDQQLSGQIASFSETHGVQLSTTLLAAYKVLLYRYSGQEDICIGIPASGSIREAVPGLNGTVVNMAALRNEVNDEMTFISLLNELRATVTEAYENEIPFEKAIEAAMANHDKSIHPLFQVWFSLKKNTDVADHGEPGAALKNNERIPNQIEIALLLNETSAGLKGTVVYNANLYLAETIERMISHYITLLGSIVQTPENKLGLLGMLSVEEEKTLLEEFNDTAADYPKETNLVLLFEEQVKKTPNAIAVVFEDQALTYSELNIRANQLANYLKSKGATVETMIPICIERSLGMIVGILGILKAGGVYVPIDPDYPADRISFMLVDTASALMLSSKASRASIQNTNIFVIEIDSDWDQISAQPEANPGVELLPSNLAYVIYTSGSTGKPKGVMIEHLNVVRLFKTKPSLYDFNEQDVWTMFHSFCFDFSVWEMYGALLFGGKLIVVPKYVTRDTTLFAELLVEQKVTVLNQTPSAFYNLQDVFSEKAIKNNTIRYVIFGGEALDPGKLKFWKEAYPASHLINMYGITETTVHVTYQKIEWRHVQGVQSIIGKPIPTLSIYILSSQKILVPIGVVGEMYVGGSGLARGYLNRSDLTKERFINNPFSNDKDSRLYKTGDLGRWLPDGTLEYLGRIDDQVKIRGYRIELGEIESLLNQRENIKQAVVLTKADSIGNQRLVGYIVPQGAFDKSAIIKYLGAKLPEYMVPAIWVVLDKLPLTQNGKVDKKNLPQPSNERPELGVLYKGASTTIEKNITAIWKELLLLDKIGVDDNFFLLGGNSLLALKAVAFLKQQFDYTLPITKLYQYPTINGIANLISGVNNDTGIVEVKTKKNKAGNGDVAIIGMTGRFPGANTIDEYWDMLSEGREGISFFGNDGLDPSIPVEVTNDPAYVKARGVIDQAEVFDAEFFGFNPRAAELMDPQQRVFLEIAREVLEDSGYLSQRYTGSVGVFAGSGFNSYYDNNILSHPKLLNGSGKLLVRLLNEKDYIATRTSFQLNLKGPAVSVHSACSTSLLAIAQAVNSIREGQCDVAIAGAASVTAPVKSGHFYEEEAILSIDGHTRSFDANATGTVFSDGAGVVLLKSLEQAEHDGDTIYAVIKGVGINNDGADKGSFSGPSAIGQAGAIVMAIKDAAIDASSISYVEAHGTATPLGDPIEIEGLNLAFGQQEEKQFCAIGSVKSNIGHLTAASGVAGLIKTVLALRHHQIPPSLFYDRSNPNINLPDSPFYVNTSLKDWQATENRRAGVSSFGFGGTNVHVILEEYQSATVQSGASAPLSLINWSAKNENSLINYGKQLAAYVEKNKEVSIADIAYSLQCTREDLNFRKFIVAADRDDLLLKLKDESHNAAFSNKLNSKPAEVVFMFPGQGSQYINMGKELYENEPVFKAAVDECVELLKDTPQADIFDVIYPRVVDEIAEEKIKNTFYTQPAIFIMNYAMAKLWTSWGIQPTIFTGHSIGEFVAAHFAGIFDLHDALHLVSARAKMVSEVAKGSMLSVRLEVDQLRHYLPSNISIAAVNSNRLCVVAGEYDAVADFGQQLAEKGIPSRLLQTSHAFHSAMMEPIVAPFEAIVHSVTLHPPIKPIISTVTGTWMSEAEATSPAYWAIHLRKTVLFANAIDALQENEGNLLLEVGPGVALATLARQQVKTKSTPIIQGFEKNETTSEYHSVLKALGQLWLNGIEPNWTAFYLHQQRLKVSLPAYVFDHKRYWLEPVAPLNSTSNTDRIEISEVDIKLNRATTEKPILDEKITRKQVLTDRLKKSFENASGVEIDQATAGLNFIEMGFDSILLMQLASNLKKEYKVQITIRKLFEEYNTLDLLASHLDSNLPEDAVY